MDHEPTQREEELFDEAVEELEKYENLAKQARLRLNEGDISTAVSILDEGDNFAGDAWRALIGKVEYLKDVQMRLYEGG